MSTESVKTNIANLALPASTMELLTVLGLDVVKAPVAKQWRRTSGHLIRWRLSGPAIRLEQMETEIQAVAVEYTLTYTGGTGTLDFSLVNRDFDVVKWEVIPEDRNEDVRGLPYFSTSNYWQVFNDYRKNEIILSTGAKKDYGTTPLNMFRDHLLKNGLKMPMSRGVIRKTTVTANETTATAAQNVANTTGAPTIPDGVVIVVDPDATYKRKAPAVTFDGATYTIIEEWTPTPYDAAIFGAAPS